MEIVGSHVKHKVFGEGVVEAQNGRYITISFEGGEKKFAYPGIFRSICEMQDEELREVIQQELHLADTEQQKKKDDEWNTIRTVQDFRTKYKIK